MGTRSLFAISPLCAFSRLFSGLGVFAWWIIWSGTASLAEESAAPLAPLPASRSGTVLISPKPGQRAALASRFPGFPRRQLLRASAGFGGVEAVHLPPGQSVESAITQLRQSGLVSYAEPDFQRSLDLTPNDPKYLDGTLWWLNNPGRVDAVVDADIDAPEAWDSLVSARNVVLAILDTGIRRTHEELRANIWTNASEGGFGLNALAANLEPWDDEGHGTLVAGVLGAAGGNGKGICGVAWQVQLMACKCFDGHRIGYDSDLIEAIEFARTHGARIINASLGAYAYSESLSNAIFAARQDGILVVASAGNDGRNLDERPYYPACYEIDNVISVGFSTPKDLLDPRSNYGVRSVDLVAPGTGMYSTFFTSDNAYLGGSFLYGSSLAAPQVSGTAALLVASYPTESCQGIIRRILRGVDPHGSLTGVCASGGRLNVAKALAARPWLSFTGSGTEGALEIRVQSQPGEVLVLESSEDLHTWTGRSTNTTAEAGVSLFEAPAAGRSRFYRIAPRSAGSGNPRESAAKN